MPEQPSLEDLARAAVEAWETFYRKDEGLYTLVAPAMDALAKRLESPDLLPPRAGAYMTSGERVQVELRFACALIAGGWRSGDGADQEFIDKARRLARLLLDGAEPHVRRGLDAADGETPCG